MGLNFPVLDYQYSLELFKQWIASRESHQVCTANVHTVVTSLTDQDEVMSAGQLKLHAVG